MISEGRRLVGSVAVTRNGQVFLFEVALSIGGNVGAMEVGL